ncbi:MAG TPA: TIGR03619 family F420-dependent LLM class oxidoreductase [Acidimicrobiales bacterium]|nr:TIGR03619 family F420-dependent LLM class oxidoreductase [Acidimicrobiales bacterium]
MKLRLGIVTPVVHINPRFEPPSWESTGTIDDIVVVAQEAERLGYDWVAASEHIAIPLDATGVRGPRYWDPVATLSYVAAHTRRIALLSHVVVLSYHHPLEIVKRWGTVDLLSHGRVILGVGVGSLQPEFELLGRRFEGRGDRGDDAIRAIRAAWGQSVPSYQGPHFRFADFVVEPSGLPRPVEIWVGGRTRRSLRRAITLGDAWIPFRLLLEDFRALFADPEIAELVARRGRPLEMILAPEPPLDPAGAPQDTLDRLRTLVDVGATGFSLRFRHHSRTHYVEQMAALQELVPAL